MAQGNLIEALEAYEAGLAIAERLAQADPGNSGWQRDLIVANVKLAEMGSSPAERFAAALEIAKRLKDEGRLAPKDEWMLPELRQRLAEAKK